MLVTTVYEPTALALNKARTIAERLGCRFVPRQQNSIRKLRLKYDEMDLVIASERELKYVNEQDATLFFHPSTAQLRVKRMLQGEEDTLIRLAGITNGDSVLDCTAGLASDSIVFSYAIGPHGHVTAIESQAIIGLLIEEGLRDYCSEVPALDEAMRRVHIIHQDHLDYLRTQPEQSVDIIYFDPMFRSPIGESSSMSPLRGTVNNNPLSIESIHEAQRVARRRIIMKEHRESDEFARLGFTEVHRTYSKIAYGVIQL